MHDDNIAIENFIAYCEDMLIAEEGLFKKFIERRHEKKVMRKRNREKLIKMSELILKYTKKYIVPHGMKIVKEITDYTKTNVRKKVLMY